MKTFDDAVKLVFALIVAGAILAATWEPIIRPGLATVWRDLVG